LYRWAPQGPPQDGKVSDAGARADPLRETHHARRLRLPRPGAKNRSRRPRTFGQISVLAKGCNLETRTHQNVFRQGGVVTIVNFLVNRYDVNILNADQHQDVELGLFFMRVEFSTDAPSIF